MMRAHVELLDRDVVAKTATSAKAANQDFEIRELSPEDLSLIGGGEAVVNTI